MANIFDIVDQKSQMLRFVNLNERTEPQNHDNRLFSETVYPFTAPDTYCVKLEKTDYLRIHYRTDYTQYKVYLIGSDGSKSEITPNETLIYTDSEGLMYYDCPVLLNYLSSGIYWIDIELIQVDSPAITFRSEPFNLKSKWKDTIWFECYGNLKTYDDSQYWVDKQGIRVRAEDKNVIFGQEKNVDTNSNYTQRTLKAKPNRSVAVQFDLEPAWVYEKLNIFLNHDEFYMNGIQYNNDEAVNVENLGRLIQYKSVIELQEYKYQDSDSKVLTGDTPILPTGDVLLINNTDALSINNNDVLTIN